ncbi:hypothetical protein ACWGDX_13200 [Streptomyces sp. NPDC055025]
MTTWQPTRKGLKEFLRDVANNPGKSYYSISDCAQPWGDTRKYREIVFKPSRLWVGTWGHHGAEGVLSLYGPISDVQPAGLKSLFEKGGPQYLPDPEKVAKDAQPKRPRIFARQPIG